ncbi:hypothetical protein L209DRAFT_265935 [Thermothelomyces heterothallicus CBS 203.75]
MCRRHVDSRGGSLYVIDQRHSHPLFSSQSKPNPARERPTVACPPQPTTVVSLTNRSSPARCVICPSSPWPTPRAHPDQSTRTAATISRPDLPRPIPNNNNTRSRFRRPTASSGARSSQQKEGCPRPWGGGPGRLGAGGRGGAEGDALRQRRPRRGERNRGRGAEEERERRRRRGADGDVRRGQGGGRGAEEDRDASGSGGGGAVVAACEAGEHERGRLGRRGRGQEREPAWLARKRHGGGDARGGRGGSGKTSPGLLGFFFLFILLPFLSRISFFVLLIVFFPSSVVVTRPQRDITKVC